MNIKLSMLSKELKAQITKTKNHQNDTINRNHKQYRATT